VSNNQLVPTLGLAAGCVALIAFLYRPLLLSSVLSELGEVRGIPRQASSSRSLLASRSPRR